MGKHTANTIYHVTVIKGKARDNKPTYLYDLHAIGKTL